jgi:hypothetical protein
MKPGGSLPFLQESATGPCPKPQESNPHPPYFSKIHFNTVLPSTSKSSKRSVPFRLPNQNFIRISHLTHECYMSAYLILLGLIITIIFGEEFKL